MLVEREDLPPGLPASPLPAGVTVVNLVVVPRFAAFDTSGLRNASSVSRLPWRGRSVTLLCVDANGVVQQAKTDSEKRHLLEAATRRDLVLVAWPGQWSQEIYIVDDLRAARTALQG